MIEHPCAKSKPPKVTAFDCVHRTRELPMPNSYASIMLGPPRV